MAGHHPHRSRQPRASYWIAARDLLEFARDRRTLVITLLLPMVTYPILALSTTLGLRTAISEIEARRVGQRVVLALSGPDAEPFADELRDFIDATPAGQRIEAGWPAEVRVRLTSEEEAANLLAAGEASYAIDVPRGTAFRLGTFGTVRLEAHVSNLRPPVAEVGEQFTALVRDFVAAVRMRRVLAAGLPATTLAPLELLMPQPPKLGPALTGSISGTIAGGVLVLLAVLTMTGAFYPAIDAIAGEKERGTIETLLIAPCSALELVVGKFLAVFAITVATLLVNLVSIAGTFAVAVRLVPRDGSALMPENILAALLVTLAAYLGLAAVAAATCLAVTTASKSGKEAQNTLTPVILLVSALAGSALLPGLKSAVLPALAPFAGQVLVAQRAFDPVADGTAALPVLLGLSLVSATVITGLLLWITSVMLTDEDVLFRGQDVAGTGFARPPVRVLPTVLQGIVPAAAGLASIWYLQGFAAADLTLAIPLQQALAVVLPLAATAWWQRVDLRRTLSLRRVGGGGPLRLAAAVVGAMLIGYGLFVIGAAIVRTRGDDMSPGMRSLAERLLALVTAQPGWVTWCLIAVLPAICEESLYRGWMLSAFAGDPRSRGRTLAAVVAQAALFAVAHLLPERMPQTFVLGVVNGWLTVTTGSLLPAILCHLVHNSVPLVLLAEWSAGGPALGMGCALVGVLLVIGSARRVVPVASAT